MQQQRGFTLIELIIVIVILGILAVTAAPRFIDLQGDARASTLDGVKAAMQGGAQLVYAKAAIQGLQGTENATVNVDGTSVSTDYGYPESGEGNFAAGLSAWLDIDVTNDFVLQVGSGTASATEPGDNAVAITPIGVTYDTAAPCYVLYNDATSGNAPVVTVVSTGC